MKRLFLFLLLASGSALAQCTFSPPAGNYAGTQTVTVTCPAGLTAFYTIDGSKPSIAGFQYTAPLTIPVTTTLRVIAAKVGVLIRNSGATNAAWVCKTTPTGHNYAPTGPNCTVGGGTGSILPSDVKWSFGSPATQTMSTTSPTSTTQMLFIHTAGALPCPNCTELVQDKIVKVDKGKTFLLNNEMDLNVNVLSPWNQFHTASLQCNQQGATPQWQIDNQCCAWQNTGITYGCPISTTQQTEIRYGMHWTNGDTSCSGFSCDVYDFLTVCLGGSNGTGGVCKDFSLGGVVLRGDAGKTGGWPQELSQQDQPDATNTTTSGANPTTSTRSIWNNNGTYAFYGTEVTSQATYNIGPLTPIPPIRWGGDIQLGGQIKIR